MRNTLRSMGPRGVAGPSEMVIVTQSISLTQEMIGYFQSKSKVKGWGGTTWYVQSLDWDFGKTDQDWRGTFYRPSGFNAQIVLREITR